MKLMISLSSDDLLESTSARELTPAAQRRKDKESRAATKTFEARHKEKMAKNPEYAARIKKYDKEKKARSVEKKKKWEAILPKFTAQRKQLTEKRKELDAAYKAQMEKAKSLATPALRKKASGKAKITYTIQKRKLADAREKLELAKSNAHKKIYGFGLGKRSPDGKQRAADKAAARNRSTKEQAARQRNQARRRK